MFHPIIRCGTWVSDSYIHETPGKEAIREASPSVQSVNMSPEKHIAAMPMKNTNCETIARSDLCKIIVESRRYGYATCFLQNDNVVRYGEKSQPSRSHSLRCCPALVPRQLYLGNRIHAPHARMSNAMVEVATSGMCYQAHLMIRRWNRSIYHR